MLTKMALIVGILLISLVANEIIKDVV